MQRGKCTLDEIEKHLIENNIEGSFSSADMEVIYNHVHNLLPGQVYLEIGVAAGKSLSTAFFSTCEGVFTIGIDYVDCTDGRRGAFFNLLTVSQIIYVQADANVFAKIWNYPIDVLFIDGAHDDMNVERDTLTWMPRVKSGGVILYHDYNQGNAEGVKIFVDKYHKKFEVLNGNIAKVIKE